MLFRSGQEEGGATQRRGEAWRRGATRRTGGGGATQRRGEAWRPGGEELTMLSARDQTVVGGMRQMKGLFPQTMHMHGSRAGLHKRTLLSNEPKGGYLYRLAKPQERWGKTNIKPYITFTIYLNLTNTICILLPM